MMEDVQFNAGMAKPSRAILAPREGSWGRYLPPRGGALEEPDRAWGGQRWRLAEGSRLDAQCLVVSPRCCGVTRRSLRAALRLRWPPWGGRPEWWSGSQPLGTILG